MGARGPKPGSGGRPRLGSKTKPRVDGYKRVTTGPAGHGTQRLEHRVKAGLGKGSQGKGTVVDHGNSDRSDNSAKNLTVMSKSKNTAKSNKRRGS